MTKNEILPDATASISGSSEYPNLRGIAAFIQTDRGVYMTIKVNGLPTGDVCKTGMFALHIHEGKSCTGNESDPFADAKEHYNPLKCPHPYHAGDLPPLIGNNGFAYMAILTNRFTVDEIIGKVVIIHQNHDDFTTQPSGNSGAKIACGKITKTTNI